MVENTVQCVAQTEGLYTAFMFFLIYALILYCP